MMEMAVGNQSNKTPNFDKKIIEKMEFLLIYSLSTFSEFKE